jgi:hypothetical protein
MGITPALATRVRGNTVLTGQLQVITPLSADPVRFGGATPVMLSPGSPGPLGPFRRKFNAIDGSSYLFEVNPNAGGSPQRRRTLTPAYTTAADGTPVVFEGETLPMTGQIQGTLRSQSQYNAFLTWYLKREVIQLTDDLGRIQYVYITSFKPTAKYSLRAPFRSAYTIDYTIVGGVNA